MPVQTNLNLIMKSINVYNALVAYKASKEAKWHDKNDVLTVEIDGNTVKFPFYFGCSQIF